MAVPSVMTDLLVAVADNVPKGTDAVTTSTGPDEFFRAHAAIVRRLQAKGANVASAATVDLGAINDGNFIRITGTTAITSFGTIAAGVSRILIFDDALTLTHDTAKIILPGGANIVTAANDFAVFISEGAGLWRCQEYQRVAVPPSVPLDGVVTTAKVADNAVTYAKIQDVSATDRLLGRATAGAGDVEEIVCTPQARALLDDATQKDQLITIGSPMRGVIAKTAAFTVGTGDRGVVFGCDGTFTITLTAANTLGDGFVFEVFNVGTGIITIDPDGTETIDGATTITVGAKESCFVVCDNGTKFITAGLAKSKRSYAETGAVATGTTTIPYDDSIPTDTEGDKYLEVVHTTKFESRVRITVNITLASSATGNMTVALYRDGTNGALAATTQAIPTADRPHTMSLVYEWSAPAATRTYSVRAGLDAAGTTTLNGVAGARKLGGANISSISVIEFRE